MDPSIPLSFTGLLNDDNNEENPTPPQASYQYQLPNYTQFQWQQFLQWQQQLQGFQQPGFTQIQQPASSKHVDESPSSKPKKAANKKGKPKKNVEDSGVVNRTRWPQGDEVLLFKATVAIGEDPAVGNNQTNHSYWSRIEKHYNDSGPQVQRDASGLRSHYHLIKPRLSKFNEFYLQSNSHYRSGWSDDDHIQQARTNFIQDPTNRSNQTFTYEHL